MELALSLGDTPKPFSSFLEKSQKIMGKDLGFCMGVDNNSNKVITEINGGDKEPGFSSSDPPVQLDLLPFSPVHKTHPSSNNSPFSWLSDKLGGGESGRGGPEMNRRKSEEHSSPSTTVSSFHMDFSMFGSNRKRDLEPVNNNNSSGENEADRVSDEDENGLSLMARKKLRLTKQQSAFLEDSFKEHNTLNPKQKLALAKQLNLRPRQVEVWFQNRRARTKLKQTEVDCEYLKKCCETLTEENRRLQKELQELRALKASQPFYMQRPATTLTMCPSCERVAATAGGGSAASNAVVSNTKPSSKRLSLSPS